MNRGVMADLDDESLYRAFTSTTLPANEWTHRAHLRVAWLFLERHDVDEAHLLFRVALIRLNGFHGLVETAARGYHETLTRAWLLLVASLRAQDRGETSGAFVDTHQERLTKNALLRHYSRDLLGSLRARTVWVEPDVSPIV